MVYILHRRCRSYTLTHVSGWNNWHKSTTTLWTEKKQNGYRFQMIGKSKGLLEYWMTDGTDYTYMANYVLQHWFQCRSHNLIPDLVEKKWIIESPKGVRDVIVLALYLQRQTRDFHANVSSRDKCYYKFGRNVFKHKAFVLTFSIILNSCSGQYTTTILHNLFEEVCFGCLRRVAIVHA